MRTIALLDTETTGLADTDTCIEVSVMVYDLAAASPIRSFSSLIRAEANPAESINRIPVEALRTAPTAESVWRSVAAIVATTEIIVAHRAEFDRRFVAPEIRDAKQWVCSKTEIDWSRGTPGDSLVTLALAHDIGVAYAHRASADVDLLARILTRSHELGVDLVAMMSKAARPRATYRALVSFDDKEKAKAAGFLFDGATKAWTKRLVIGEPHTFPFEVREVAT